MAKQHLYEIDLLRAFVILGVVCVHGISFFNLFTHPMSNTNIGFEASLTAFHFTREAFMLMTGLVLFITYYNKPFKATSFWAKRFKLIFIPYAAFTILYILFEGTYLRHFQWTASSVLSNIGMSLLTGKQFYLYYLVISMQLYLVFPLFVRLLKALARWHGWVFVISLALELVAMRYNQAVLEHVHPATLPGWLAVLWRYRDRNILTYQFWFVSGAIIAIHYQKFKPFLLRHTKLLVFTLLGGLVVLEGHFALQRFVYHETEGMSVLVLQPIMVLWSFVVAMALLRAGMKWSDVRLKPSVRWFSKYVETAGAASFGVFLVHPFILHYVEVAVYRLHPTAGVRLALVPIAILVIYSIGILIATLIGRIPVVSYIVGQKTSLPNVAKRKSVVGASQ